MDSNLRAYDPNLKEECLADFGLYSIYDRVAGRYGEPFCCNAQELAVRRFDYLMANSPMVCNDCELYKLGIFDSIKGVIVPCSNPLFVVKFDSKRSEVYNNG